MKPKVTMRKALSDKQLLGSIVAGDSWYVWRVFLVAMAGERLTPKELDVFREFTGRDTSPPAMVDEAALVIGRRGGKDRATSVLAAYIAALCDHKLARGEKGVLLVIAPDQRQARIQVDYIAGAFDSSPILRRLVERRTTDTIELTNGISIEVRAASFRRLRGVTTIAVIASEAAFWHSEDSANPDTEILNAVRPSLATTSGPLILISSPYARRGELWTLYRQYYAKNDPNVLIVQGPSTAFNPTLPQKVIDRALSRDEAAAKAEYFAQFRTDIEALITREIVEACVSQGVHERPRAVRTKYFAFTDPSGGSSDSFTLAIAHKDGDTVVLDAIRERKPPFSPDEVVSEFANLIKSYGISRVMGDRYGGEWPREAFRKQSITYEVSPKSKSEMYLAVLPLLNAKRADLLDHPQLINQLVGLERRTARSGKDSVDHAPHGHDDVANAMAGAFANLTAYRGSYDSSLRWVSDDTRSPNQASLMRYVARGGRF